MILFSRSIDIRASAEQVFAYIDDIRHLAEHMSAHGTTAMFGSKLNLDILSPEPTGEGAIYRYSGKILGLTLDFSERVTEYHPPHTKAWRTIGTPRLLIISHYEMRFAVVPLPNDLARLTIDFLYDLPAEGLWRWIGGVLAPQYAAWCVDAMLQGTKASLERGRP